MQKNSLIVITVDAHPELSLDELCSACDVTPEFIKELIEYGAIEPRGYSSETWSFNAEQLRRVRIIVNLQKDLELNTAGAVLVVDLMQEMKQMRDQMDLFEKYLHITHER